jgi:hypothetical protein
MDGDSQVAPKKYMSKYVYIQNNFRYWTATLKIFEEANQISGSIFIGVYPTTS